MSSILKEFKIELLESHIDVLLKNIKSMAAEIARLHAILDEHNIDILAGEIETGKPYHKIELLEE